MKRITDFLFSSTLMAIVLGLFAISIAVATFIENDFGSASARAAVYNARWFELLLLVGMINLTGSIFTKKLYAKGRFTVFVFHFSFLLILLGAAITRYAGFEGSLSILEGETSNKVLTDKAYIEVKTENETKDFPVFFSAFGRSRFNEKVRINNSEVSIEVVSFVPNAVQDIESDPQGIPRASLVYTDMEGRKNLIIASGEQKFINNIAISFDTAVTDSADVRIFASGDSLVFFASFDVTQTNMGDQTVTTLPANVPHRFYPMQLYSFGHNMIVLNKYFSRGRLTAKSLSSKEGESMDALTMKVNSDGVSKEFVLWGKRGYPSQPEAIQIKNQTFSMSYGSIYKELPFALKLNDFIVDRYPGSNSPSWFESKVVLIDVQNNLAVDKRIYMNNILKYKGYRFYQSSYDPSEKGTVLSVNRDWAGTLVTYAGYLLMAIGMLLSLINAKSRFRSLSVENKLLRDSKKALLILGILMSFGTMHAQDGPGSITGSVIDPDHAKLAGKLLLQDNGGRIEPLNTLSSEVLRKLYRKSQYNGLSANQVFLGMMVDPNTWQHEALIRAPHPQIQEIMGNKGKYYSFVSFFNNNQYILQDYVEKAYQKKPAYRSKFDNELIRLDERINICYLIFTGEMFRVLPIPGDSTNTWVSHQNIRGRVNSGDSVFLNSVIPYYIQDVQSSLQSGDWKSPNDIIGALSDYQVKISGAILPPKAKVSMEIFMNEFDIFSRISKLYGVIGIFLLILQFIGIFYSKLKLKVPVMVSMVLIIMLFIMHTAGLGMRWYVSGHAPWSNGYEALTYIAWASVLAGLIFLRRSSITLSATAVLAFLILHTAHLSWMDPQITNLVPVLKSYWLVIHVATITASYGFLALGALLASVDLLLMLMITKKRYSFINLTIKELSNIIEMTLIVGLYLLAIGTFLGGVWANESWGRYWGWDPKETWALVTVLLYAFVAHMRMVPGLRGLYAFNLASLLAFGSVIMTYFGVNYYLSGLHSYAAGDPLPVPSFVYYTLAIVLAISLMAFMNYRKVIAESAKPA